MKWWRSRYVQHLEAENAELREQIKLMTSPQSRYLVENSTPSAAPEKVKMPRRPSWQETAAKLEYLVSPEAVIDRKKSEREAALRAAQEN